MSEIQVGKYRHFKGKEYEVIGCAKHSETLEELVVYRPLYLESGDLWVRPKAMFFDTVMFNNTCVRRFELILPNKEKAHSSSK